MKIVYAPDPRAGATLYRTTDTGRWIWCADGTRPSATDRLVAVVDGRSRVSGLWDESSRHYYSRGTLVHGQRRGTATRLWSYLILTLAPVAVSVDVITDAGLALMARLRRRSPAIRWSISDMRSIADSLATLAAEPYRPTKQDVVAVRDAAGSSLYRAQDALVRYRGDVAAAIEFLAPQTK